MKAFQNHFSSIPVDLSMRFLVGFSELKVMIHDRHGAGKRWAG
jgi:hypothetical protein